MVSGPKRRPVVAELSRDDVANIYQVRGTLEALAAKLFAEVATDEKITELERSVEDLAVALRDRDMDRTMEVKDRFYSNLVEGFRQSPHRFHPSPHEGSHPNAPARVLVLSGAQSRNDAGKYRPSWPPSRYVTVKQRSNCPGVTAGTLPKPP